MNNKPSGSFAEKVIKSSSLPIHFITCKDLKNRDCFYVIMCSAAKLKLMLNTQTAITDLNDEGQVLASGFGHEIPLETKAMLKEKYGFDADTLK